MEFNQVDGEMSNRFAHQNNVVDNVSKLVTTIQRTLEVMGTDV